MIDEIQFVCINPNALAGYFRKVAYWEAVSLNTKMAFESHEELSQKIIGAIIGLFAERDGKHAGFNTDYAKVKQDKDYIYLEITNGFDRVIRTGNHKAILEFLSQVEYRFEQNRSSYMRVMEKAQKINNSNNNVANNLKIMTASLKLASSIAITFGTIPLSAMAGFAISTSYAVGKGVLPSLISQKKVIVAVKDTAITEVENSIKGSAADKFSKIVASKQDTQELRKVLARHSARINKNKSFLDRLSTDYKSVAKNSKGFKGAKQIRKSAVKVMDTTKKINLNALAKAPTKILTGVSVINDISEFFEDIN